MVSIAKRVPCGFRICHSFSILIAPPAAYGPLRSLTRRRRIGEIGEIGVSAFNRRIQSNRRWLLRPCLRRGRGRFRIWVDSVDFLALERGIEPRQFGSDRRVHLLQLLFELR